MNSAAAIVVSGKVAAFTEAFEIAQEAVDSGRALAKLEEIRKISRSL
jgi:anthranilate phosphoribosyltransferase